jgi:hypothetical protein
MLKLKFIKFLKTGSPHKKLVCAIKYKSHKDLQLSPETLFWYNEYLTKYKEI